MLKDAGLQHMRTLESEKEKKYRFNYSVRATIESELRKDTDIFTENH